MPEKINFNKSQKEKQFKILNYYRKNMKGKSIKEVPKPVKRTKKQLPIQEKLTKKHDSPPPTRNPIPNDETVNKANVVKDKENEKKELQNKQIVNMD